MDIERFVELLGQEKAIAILRADDQQKAAQAMDAAIRGGFRIVEFTLTVPGAFELVQEFAARGDVTVGVGTVTKRWEVKRAVDAGASFVVSPMMDESVIRSANEMRVACLPGTYTASEMYRAHEAGATFCKLFPAPASGPKYVRAMLGPMPQLKIVPTNEVDHHNAGEWLQAGCFAVGFVAPLFEPGFLANSDWDAIEKRAGECLAATREVG